MSLKDFRSTLLDRLTTFAWRQWSALGVLGSVGAEEEWVLDPEPLLVFSLEIGRYEPRLFDEVLKWILVNGEWLDVVRLRNILKNRLDDEAALRLAGAAISLAAAKGDRRKWASLAGFLGRVWGERYPNRSEEVLFKGESGQPHPSVPHEMADPNFSFFGLNRPRARVAEKEAYHTPLKVPINARTNMRFLLRSLFGAGAKSEAVLYLLTHEGGHPREIADAVGLFWLSIHQAILELSKSGLVLTRSKGKKVEYWLSQPKWWDFLASSDYETTRPPKYLNWIAIFSALSTAWKTVDEIALSDQSDYMKSSKLHDSLEVVAHEFARAGYDISRMPRPGLPPDLHQKMALRFLGEIVGMKEESATV